MDELDSLFEGELASIDQVFQEFEIKDKKTEKRNMIEQEDLERVKIKNTDLAPQATLELLEEVSKRKSRESMNIEHQWEEEMQALEQERLKELEQQQHLPEDDLVQNLDSELKSLIQTKAEETKQAQQQAQQLKLLREEREKEEQERKEKERLEKLANGPPPDVEEMTVEEWIAWMVEKKKEGMTPEQQAEYERRKKLRQEKERERAERLRREDEEKRRKTREKMDKEMTAYRQRQLEVQEARLTEEQLQQKQEEMARRHLEESKLRKQRGEKMRHEDKEREIEALKPKARSALAARWEESVKARTNGKSNSRAMARSTVMTGEEASDVQLRRASGGYPISTSALEKEEERLVKRISGGYSAEKRMSMQ